LALEGTVFDERSARHVRPLQWRERVRPIKTSPVHSTADTILPSFDVHGVARNAFEHFARTLFRLYARLDVSACELLPSEPFLLCSNHTSHLDGTALMVASGLPFDAFRLLAAADYFDPRSSTGRLTRVVLNIVAVDRVSGQSARLRRTLSECRELVRTHQVRLIAFPEGTRSTTDDLLPFKRGPAFLAVGLDVPVVPAYIDGARAAMPKGCWIPRPKRVRVQFGRPIRPAEWAVVPGRKARFDYVTRELEQRIGNLARGR
jgi:1-acyl-sn-glycerol-3-phosphate acyltransferase/long-chain acyl-CoA synthetase